MDAFRLGIDVGGTFTDVVAINEADNTIYVEKVPTTLDVTSGFFNGLDRIASKHRFSIGDVDKIIHGTTIGGNALIERTGVKTGLITTNGSKDALEIRREMRYDLYDLNLKIPPPLVPRYLRKEVQERILPDGKVLTSLDLTHVQNVASELINEGVESIAICFLHSYINSSHEMAAKNIILREHPNISISTSCETLPFIKEYERTSTVVINAYIKPIVDQYISKIEDGLRERDFKGELFIMTSAGGMITSKTAREYPIRLLESGPAAGASMANYLSQRIGDNNILAFDMGGTTAKGCLIKSKVLPKSYELEVARNSEFKKGSGISVITPNVTLIDIGGGGGSIATLDEMRIIKVGPKGTGANPGPACYGRGGELPTVTDADLILGYLDPNYFLGGEMSLTVESSKKAVKANIAEPLDIDVAKAAWGIHETVNGNISMDFQAHAAERGLDYRGYTLVAFGGAGPIHASRVAKKLKIGRIIIPYRSGVFSSIGLLATPISFDLSKTHHLILDDNSPKAVEEVFTNLTEQGISLICDAGVPRQDVRVSKILDMRYEGQGHEIEVIVDSQKYDLNYLKKIFEKEYRNIYSINEISESIEILNFKVFVSGSAPILDLKTNSASSTLAEKSRKVFFGNIGDYVDTPVYNRNNLKPGLKFDGPAIVEERESTYVLQPNERCSIDDYLNIIVETE